jgi:hypothetical protein
MMGSFLSLVLGWVSLPDVPIGKLTASSIEDSSRVFLAVVNGHVFSSRPASMARTGKPIDYRTDDLIWLNALRGGYSKSDYPYFTFRSAQSGNPNDFDIVFFNGSGVGFYVPISAANSSGGQEISFTLVRAGGGGEAAQRKEVLQFTLSCAKSPAGSLQASIVSAATSRWMMVKEKQSWSARMEFSKSDVPSAVIEKAKLGAVPYPGSSPQSSP